MQEATSTHKQLGATLMEVLIALFVLSVGMLGVAGMQTRSVLNSYSAYNITQATTLATDIIDRIRANPEGAAHYVNFDTKSHTPVDPGCISKTCSPENIANHDKFQWSQPLNSAKHPVLPDGRGIITRNGETFSVVILWHEKPYFDVGNNVCINDQPSELTCQEIEFRL